MTSGDLLDAFQRDLEHWSARVRDSSSTLVQPGSDLDVDTKLTQGGHLEYMAWNVWESGVDHLLALRPHLTGESTATYAPFSLIRIATENAAAAVWLLMSDESPQRVTRRLRLEWSELRDEENAAALMPPEVQPAPHLLEDAKSRVENTARRAGLDLKAIRERLNWSKLVAEAGTAVPIGSAAVEYTWRVCSAFAHGRDRVRFMLDQQRQIKADGSVAVTFQLTPERLIEYLPAPYELTAAAARLYDKRRLAWRES